jgi:ATP-binding cassette subfamily F protein 3
MLHIQNLSKSYGVKLLFQDVSFSVDNNDKIGFVAPNGSGKSTLLKIILGLEEPERGTVTVTHEEIGYLPQTIDARPDDTIHTYLHAALAEEWEEYKIDMALSQVNLTDIDRTLPISSLSGGQKTKVGLARLLIHEPTTIFLDEPTNNLDLESLAWLEKFIRRFKGNIIVISHDRAFLDNTVKKILELDPYRHTLYEYAGGYTDYKHQKALREERELAEYNREEKRRQHFEQLIKDQQSKLANRADPAAGKRLRAMKTRYQREFIDNGVERPPEQKTMRIGGFGDESYRKRVVFYVEQMQFKDIIGCEKLTITAGDRIHLQGENGSGKSTLIKLLLGRLTPDTGTIEQGHNMKIGYFDQEHDLLDYDKTVIENLMLKTGRANETSARKILGKFLFSGEHAYALVKEISQGERVKLIIAILTHQNNQFLILDEPTIHLDIESREVLEQALLDYEGGLLIVSHDRYFVDELQLNRVLRVEEGMLRAQV